MPQKRFGAMHITVSVFAPPSGLPSGSSTQHIRRSPKFTIGARREATTEFLASKCPVLRRGTRD